MICCFIHMSALRHKCQSVDLNCIYYQNDSLIKSKHPQSYLFSDFCKKYHQNTTFFCFIFNCTSCVKEEFCEVYKLKEKLRDWIFFTLKICWSIDFGFKMTYWVDIYTGYEQKVIFNDKAKISTLRTRIGQQYGNTPKATRFKSFKSLIVNSIIQPQQNQVAWSVPKGQQRKRVSQRKVNLLEEESHERCSG